MLTNYMKPRQALDVGTITRPTSAPEARRVTLLTPTWCSGRPGFTITETVRCIFAKPIPLPTKPNIRQNRDMAFNLTHKLNAQGTYDRRWWWKHIGGPIYIPFLEWKLRRHAPSP